MTKRQARMQLTKDDPDADSNQSDTESPQTLISENNIAFEKSKRTFVIPKSMSGTRLNNPVNISSPFPSQTLLSSSLTRRQVNQSFKEQIEKALIINAEADLTVFFEKYKKDLLAIPFPSGTETKNEPFKFNFQFPTSKTNSNSDNTPAFPAFDNKNITNPPSVAPATCSDVTNFITEKKKDEMETSSIPKFNFQFSGQLPSFNFNLPSSSSFSSSSSSLIGIEAKGKSDGNESIMKRIEEKDQDQENEDEDGNSQETQEPPSTIAFQSGEGEEDEETIMEQRVKVHQFDKEKGWIDLGIAIFKIKSNKIVGKRERILCRAEGSAKVLINSLITSTITAYEDEKRDLHLMVFDEKGITTKYLIRIKQAQDAKKIHETINSYK